MNRTAFGVSLPERFDVLGVGVHALDPEHFLALLDAAIRRRRKGYVCFAPVHGIMEARRDSELADAYRNAMLVTPDGMPVVWVGRALGEKSMRRVAGPEAMLAVMGDLRFRNCRHLLCGGEEGLAEELKNSLLARFPSLRIVGAITPPFRPMTVDEEHEFIETVHRARPDIVWVGLGAPKQEKFMHRFLPLLDTTLMLGVGAAFLMHTGRIADSPQWVKSAGLQWFHRLLQEPRRLWRRYLLDNPRFVIFIALQLLGLTHPRQLTGSLAVDAKRPVTEP
jgi:N-acetylglucosaminyldiphosphoundecaprenol N-acetyl-beta-D-mannosaminyltransferase